MAVRETEARGIFLPTGDPSEQSLVELLLSIQARHRGGCSRGVGRRTLNDP